MTNKIENEFVKYLKETFDINLTPTQLQQFEIYYSFLTESNEIINLTAIKEKEGVFFKHFADSLSIYKALTENKKIIDVGFGAGFPSIPLKIINPKLQFTLVDNDKTKCIFIKRLIHLLDLDNIIVINSDIRKLSVKYDVFISRAFTSLDNLMDISNYILKKNGLLVYQTMKDETPTLKEGFFLRNSFRYTLPQNTFININHYIIKK